MNIEHNNTGEKTLVISNTHAMSIVWQQSLGIKIDHTFAASLDGDAMN